MKTSYTVTKTERKVEVDNFRMDNTEGYTQPELDALNKELADRLAESWFEPGSTEWNELIKNFNDEVSRR